MEGYTNTGANAALGSLITNAGYLGFSTSEPTDAGGNITEPSDSYYHRVRLATSSGGTNTFIVGIANHKITNSETIYMPEPSVNWGTLNWFCLFTSFTGGQPYFVGKLMNDGGTQGVTVNANNIFFIRQGELEISLDGSNATASSGS